MSAEAGRLVQALADANFECGEHEGSDSDEPWRDIAQREGDALQALAAYIEALEADRARLDWLEQERANVYAVTADEWEVGTAPRLLRYTVEPGGWRLTGRPNDFPDNADAETLREAIDAAMEAGK